jgi:hypothetical protein
MVGRIVSVIAVLATLSVVSVPAQQSVLPASPLTKGNWIVTAASGARRRR